jgi:4-hydroxybenzoate polyprenyltransferase
MVACGLFTLGAAATYLVNDLSDRRRDALHPTKRTRPIASGAIRPGLAAALAGLLYALLALAIVAEQGPMVTPVVVYVVMNLLYSRFLKHVALLDIFVLAAGFVLRVLTGALAVGAPVSSWLVLCVLSGSLVLALGKRRQEMTQSVSTPQAQRPALRGYSAQLIDNLLPIAGAVCMVAYVSMLGAEVAHRPFGMPMVLVSTLLAMFGLARYIQVLLGGGGADPARTMLRDPALLAVGVLWAGTFIAVPMVAGP